MARERNVARDRLERCLTCWRGLSCFRFQTCGGKPCGLRATVCQVRVPQITAGLVAARDGAPVPALAALHRFSPAARCHASVADNQILNGTSVISLSRINSDTGSVADDFTSAGISNNDGFGDASFRLELLAPVVHQLFHHLSLQFRWELSCCRSL